MPIMTTIDDLPDEIHLTIAGLIDPREWRATKYSSYRLTSRRYARIGAQKMFENFQFRPTTDALVRMDGMINAGLAKWVHCLDYEGDKESRSPGGKIMHTRIFRDVVLGFARAGSPFNWLGALQLNRKGVLEGAEMASACEKLTMLDMHFVGFVAGRDEAACRAFVRGMAGLETLTLSFDDQYASRYGSRHPDDAREPPRMEDVLPAGEHVWPRLRCVVLEWLVVAESELSGLLQRHAVTLESLYLKGLVLHVPEGEEREVWVGRSWRRLFAQIARMGVLKHGDVTNTAPENGVVWKVKVEGQEREVEIRTNLTRWLNDSVGE
jgi:hypothetical protein